MKKHKFFFGLVWFCFLLGQSQNLPSIHQYTASTIDGDDISLSKYYGKKVMFVNTASFCGYTPQFAVLELLYKNFKQFNFEIVGFPSNDFGSQDPYSDSIINVFCSGNYGVTFQMMSKVAISKGDTSDVYRFLQQKKYNGVKTQAVDWNFNKFLINESGQWVKHFSSQTQPNDTAIIHWILSASSIKTGINEIQKKNDVYKLLSPNPSNSFIELELNEPNKILSIQLFAYNGQLIKQITQLNTNHIQWPVNELEQGIYVLVINTAQSSHSSRVLIQH